MKRTWFAGLLALACCLEMSLKMSAAEDKLPKTIGEIERLDPAFDKLVAKGAAIDVLAGGFEWSEGPLYMKDGAFLIFSDIPRNMIVKWKEGAGTSTYMEKSGYTGEKPFTGEEPGSNGLTLNAQGLLHMACHGDRCIKRREKDGKLITIADKYEGKRLNSPNDLVFKKNGDLYFTDPIYGLPKRWDDPGRELDFCGVYRLGTDGKLTLLTKEMTRPNGIAFSPDEKTLYVAQSDPEAAIWKSFPVKEDGTLGPSKVFYDSTQWVNKRKGLPDGLKVDTQGNLWATGPGGVLVFNPEGKLLGRLGTGEATANCAWGDDGSTLYITADMYFCRVKTMVKGTMP